MDWFIGSDYHAYHANVILYSNRPFYKKDDLNEKGWWKNKEIAKQRAMEMTDWIVNQHNQKVKKNDFYVDVGDIFFRSANLRGNGLDYRFSEFLERLNGIPILIQGNHGKSNGVKTKIQSLVLQGPGYSIKVVHKPIHADPSFPLNICGHTHSKEKIKSFKEVYESYKKDLNRDDLPKEYINSIKQFMEKWKHHPKQGVILNASCDAHNYGPISFEEVICIYNKFRKNNATN